MKKEQETTTRDKEFINKILAHYNKFGRHDLSWRKNITPYKILVSEIMLQQTQVSRVLGKYSEWMKVYPTLGSLKCASLKELLILWQGLGYQRRVKALYTIAINEESLPKKHEDLLILPGIGEYTASAIMAFAYNRFSVPVLETNIRTVIIDSYHADEENINDIHLKEDLFRLERCVEVQNVGARVWYYALMDYGSYLKSNRISHNTKSVHNSKQSKYKGSTRELRAKILFSIAKGEKLPKDERVEGVIKELISEKFITTVAGKKYSIL